MIVLISLRYDKFSEKQLEKWIFLTNFAENNELSRQFSVVGGQEATAAVENCQPKLKTENYEHRILQRVAH